MTALIPVMVLGTLTSTISVLQGQLRDNRLQKVLVFIKMLALFHPLEKHCKLSVHVMYLYFFLCIYLPYLLLNFFTTKCICLLFKKNFFVDFNKLSVIAFYLSISVLVYFIEQISVFTKSLASNLIYWNLIAIQ